MVTLGNRIYAISADGLTVRFCANGNPMDWTTASNAGFLPVSQHFGSGQRAYAIGAYQGRLAVFTDASIQIWNVDPDPTRMSLSNVVDGVGTRHHTSIVSLQGDLIFLSESGIRSLTTLQNSAFPTDIDIGLAVKKITTPVEGATGVIALAALPFAQYWIKSFSWDVDHEPDNGMQLGWLSWSYSSQAKLNAWATHGVGTEYKDIQAWTSLKDKVYARFVDDTNLYQIEMDVHGNDEPINGMGLGEDKICFADTQWLDFKTPGLEKALTGIDFDGVGLDRVEIYSSAGGNREGVLMEALAVGGNQGGWTYSGELIPISAHGTEFKLRFVGLPNVDVQINRMTLYFENLR
jgi:hypothetical protein